MAADAVTINSAVVNPDGTLDITWTGTQAGGGNFVRYRSLADFRERTAGSVENDAEALKIFLAYWLAKDPTQANPALVVGHTLTVDLAGNKPLNIV